MSDKPLVRALRTAVRVPGTAAPFDTAHLTVRYPALPATTDVERMSGMLPADTAAAPYPVVVLVPGVNVAADGYRWLAIRLVEAGFVTVGFDWVADLFPGQRGLSPGVDMEAVTPEGYGTKPTTHALRPVLDEVARLNYDGQLAGLLDLDRIALFGHSAGGTVILQSARPEWFPTVRAVVAYGAHTMASQQLGHPAGTLLPAPVQAPVLLVGGTNDGVVAASAIRYGAEAGAPNEHGHDPIERTWREALPTTTESWLVLLDQAGHMLPAWPEDPTSARGFLEEPVADPRFSDDHLRDVLAELVTTFLAAHLHADPAAKAALEAYVDQPPPELAAIRRR